MICLLTVGMLSPVSRAISARDSGPSLRAAASTAAALDSLTPPAPGTSLTDAGSRLPTRDLTFVSVEPYVPTTPSRRISHPPEAAGINFPALQNFFSPS
ncbi:hypothetical protein GCM10009676_34210 [Prauserella halophila]|uniref:Secreted protein n=1 Tax=Prauserella halophila TaxID=185641 RepID=A0ABN1WC80_9PSEU